MTEHAKARRWRERLGLSMAELARLTGYSPAAICWFEQGITPPRTFKNAKRKGRAIHPQVWLRYKRACHSVSTREKFEW
jgi:predicted transcriptional regulator